MEYRFLYGVLGLYMDEPWKVIGLIIRFVFGGLPMAPCGFPALTFSFGCSGHMGLLAGLKDLVFEWKALVLSEL